MSRIKASASWQNDKAFLLGEARRMAASSFGVRADVDRVYQNAHCGFLALDVYDLKTASTETG